MYLHAVFFLECGAAVLAHESVTDGGNSSHWIIVSIAVTRSNLIRFGRIVRKRLDGGSIKHGLKVLLVVDFHRCFKVCNCLECWQYGRDLLMPFRTRGSLVL